MSASLQYPPSRQLEIVCGAGRILEEWHRLEHSGEALDPDATAGNSLECVWAFDVGFEVCRCSDKVGIDYLVTTGVIEHVDDPATLLKVWVACLRLRVILWLIIP